MGHRFLRQRNFVWYYNGGYICWKAETLLCWQSPYGSYQGYGLPRGHIWFWELDREEGKTPKNWCFHTVVLEKTPESPLDSKEIKPINPRWKSTLNIHWKNWCWSSNSLATWSEEPTQWKRPWCWERLRAGGEGGDTGWDVWMASSAQWTWALANSGRSWWTREPGVL